MQNADHAQRPTQHPNQHPNQRPLPQEAFDWYDEYAHGLIDRRTFLTRLGQLTALGFSMSLLTSALLPDYALAEQISFNDPDIKATFVNFHSPEGHGECQGYLVLPKDLAQDKNNNETKNEKKNEKKAGDQSAALDMVESTKRPVVLIIHENRGLNPYVKDVARRAAKAGFIAFAPDALHPLGGYPGNDDDGRKMQRSMDRSKLEADFIAAANFIKTHPLSSGQLGTVGFCFGGYIVNMLAASIPDVVNASVAFYGSPPAEPLRKNVKGPLMLQFGSLDKRVNATWPNYEKVLKENGAAYIAHTYDGANHGFHNDSTSRYVEKDAELAWARTLEFYRTHLR